MGIAGFADVEQEGYPCASLFLPRFPSQDGPRECRWQRALTWRETLARPGPATAQEVPCPSRACPYGTFTQPENLCLPVQEIQIHE